MAKHRAEMTIAEAQVEETYAETMANALRSHARSQRLRESRAMASGDFLAATVANETATACNTIALAYDDAFTEAWTLRNTLSMA